MPCQESRVLRLSKDECGQLACLARDVKVRVPSKVTRTCWPYARTRPCAIPSLVCESASLKAVSSRNSSIVSLMRVEFMTPFASLPRLAQTHNGFLFLLKDPSSRFSSRMMLSPVLFKSQPYAATSYGEPVSKKVNCGKAKDPRNSGSPNTYELAANRGRPNLGQTKI